MKNSMKTRKIIIAVISALILISAITILTIALINSYKTAEVRTTYSRYPKYITFTSVKISESPSILIIKVPNRTKKFEMYITCLGCTLLLCKYLKINLSQKAKMFLNNLAKREALVVLSLGRKRIYAAKDCEQFTRLYLTHRNVSSTLMFFIVKGKGVISVRYVNTSLSLSRAYTGSRAYLDHVFIWLKFVNVSSRVPEIGNRTLAAYYIKLRFSIPQGCELHIEEIQVSLAASAEVYEFPEGGGYLAVSRPMLHVITSSITLSYANNVLTLKGLSDSVDIDLLKFLNFGYVILTVDFVADLKCGNSVNYTSFAFTRLLKVHKAGQSFWMWS